MVKRITILICLIFTSKQVFAEPIEPIFSGMWYREISFVDYDNCDTEMYNYVDQNSNPDAIAETYMKTLPSYSGCIWSIDEKENDSYSTPEDFPGSYSAYQQVLAENEPATLIYDFECRLGNEYKDHKVLYIYPNYTCPTGSRNGFDKSNDLIGCTNTPTLCMGDVVTRNLNMLGIGAVGHSGVTNPWDLIDNVLPTNPLSKTPSDNLINQTDFFVFYHTSDYWGDNYGVPDQPIVSEEQGTNIFDSVNNNINFLALYTYFTEFTPAESFESAYTYDVISKVFQKAINNQTEKWRCDTFADWVYYEGTGEMPLPFIPDSDDQGSYKYTNSMYLPVDLYANLINTRDNGIDGQVNINTGVSITKDNEHDKELFNYAVKISKTLINSVIPRDEQLQTLVQLLNEQPDDEHYSIVADALASLHPIEKTDLILQQYNKDDSVSKKEWILYMLESASELKTPIPQENNIIKIQDFLSKIITSETNPRVLESIVHAYNNIMPFSQEKVDTITQALERIPDTSEYEGDKILNKFLLAINAPTSDLMNQLIKTMQSSNEALSFEFFVSNAIINGLPLNLVLQETKMDLNNYIVTRLKSNQPAESNSLKQSKAAYPEYYKLIKAYGLLNNNEKLSSNYIMNLNNSLLQARMVNFAYFDKQSPAIFKNLNRDELLLSYQDNVKNVSTLTQAKNEDYLAYKSAIAILDGSYSKYMQKQVKLYKNKKNH